MRCCLLLDTASMVNLDTWKWLRYCWGQVELVHLIKPQQESWWFGAPVITWLSENWIWVCFYFFVCMVFLHLGVAFIYLFIYMGSLLNLQLEYSDSKFVLYKIINNWLMYLIIDLANLQFWPYKRPYTQLGWILTKRRFYQLDLHPMKTNAIDK